MLKRILGRWLQFLRGRRSPPSTIVDPVLGRLISYGGGWEGELRLADGRSVELGVFGGEDQPEVESLELCRQFALKPAEFAQQVDEFLRGEARQRQWRNFAAEIVRQRISSVSIGRKRAPLEGWIFLEDSADPGTLSDDDYSDRAWRCWYSAGKLSGLAFDS
jgi:hypothetical protein